MWVSSRVATCGPATFCSLSVQDLPLMGLCPALPRMRDRQLEHSVPDRLRTVITSRGTRPSYLVDHYDSRSQSPRGFLDIRPRSIMKYADWQLSLRGLVLIARSLTWRRSSRCYNGECVELGRASVHLYIRDSKHPGQILDMPVASGGKLINFVTQRAHRRSPMGEH